MGRVPSLLKAELLYADVSWCLQKHRHSIEIFLELLVFKFINCKWLVLALADLKLVGRSPLKKPFWVSLLVVVLETLIIVKVGSVNSTCCDRGGVLSYFDIPMVKCIVTKSYHVGLAQVMC